MAADAQIDVAAINARASIVGAIVMDLAVTLIHQHVGAQRDHGRIYRH